MSYTSPWDGVGCGGAFHYQLIISSHNDSKVENQYRTDGEAPAKFQIDMSILTLVSR